STRSTRACSGWHDSWVDRRRHALPVPTYQPASLLVFLTTAIMVRKYVVASTLLTAHHRGIHRRSVKTMANSDCLNGASAATERLDSLVPGGDGPSEVASVSREQWLEQLGSDERGCALWEAWGRLKLSRRLAVLREAAA